MSKAHTKTNKNKGGGGNLGGDETIFMSWGVMMVSGCIFIQTHQDVYIKYVLLFMSADASNKGWHF